MNKIYEMEFWSQPGSLLEPEYGCELKSAVDSALSLNNTVFLGLSNVPSPTDTENLLHSLNEAELSITEFEIFCKSHALDPSVNNNQSAASFLEYMYGRVLAWLHIPRNTSGLAMFNSLVKWSSENNFNIQCGHQLYCVNSNLTEEPLNW